VEEHTEGASRLQPELSSMLKISFASILWSCAQEWGLCREKNLLLHLNCL